MNKAILIGRLTRDVELKYTPTSGTAIATFSIAIDRLTAKDGKKETDFIPIQVFGKSAENAANYISKGSLVAVDGQIRVNKYEHNGEKRTFTYVAASRVKFLDSKKDAKDGDIVFTPSNRKPKFDDSEPYVPTFNPNDFQQIDDDDIPF